MYQIKNHILPSWLPNELPREISRVTMANLPTPIQRLHFSDSILPRELEIELYIKRDDYSGSELSGNKIRKLEFILADVLSKGFDSIVTLGGIQSNHCRATVAAANALGLEAHVVLRTSRFDVDDDPGLAGNLLISRMANAHIHLVTKEEYARYGQSELGNRVVDKLRSAGKNPYFIVVGGSSALGTYGYVNCVQELEQQQDNDRPFDKIAVACGSGGTVAGIALGLFFNPKFNCTTTLDAIMVCDHVEYFTDYIVDVFADLGLEDARAREVLERTTTFVQGKGAGYSISKDEELDTILAVASETSICLDPTYTGKALHYLLKHICANPDEYRGKKILFLHTGGIGSLYGNEALEKRIGGSYARLL